MSEPTIFARLRELKEVVEYRKLPPMVMIDIGEEMQEFLSVCDDLEDFGASLDSVLEEVFLYLHSEPDAEKAIEQLYADMLGFYTREWSGVSPSIIAEAFRKFAKAMLVKFSQYGMYTKEGLLPYILRKFLDERTVWMERYDDSLHGMAGREVKNTGALKIHHTMGLYGDGSRTHNGVAPKNLQDHIAFNKVYRPGRALFVDGVCVHRAGLSEEHIAMAEDELRANPVVMPHDTAPYT